MKNQYVADVNDYVKYGILRQLAGESALPVTAVWMLTPDDGSTDGRRKRYLDQPSQWRDYDPELFDRLRALVCADADVAAIERAGLVPGCVWFSRPVPSAPDLRRRFFSDVLACSHGKGIVFLDPDNGIEVPSTPYGRRDSSKYVYLRELSQLFSRGQSLLVYQHFPRVERPAYLGGRFAALRTEVGATEMHAFVSRYCVALLVPRPEHAEVLARASRLAATRWLGAVEYRWFEARQARRRREAEG